MFSLPLDTGVKKWSRGTPNAQNMVALNSPNDKLSNDTPHDYGTLKYKIAVLRGFKGVLG